MGNPDDLGSASLEVEDSGSDQDSGTTQTVWSPTCRDPGAVHRLKEAGGKPDHVLKLVSKLEPVAKSPDKEAGVDEWDREVKFLHKLHVDLPQIVHVGLDCVREVNQKVRSIFLDSTSRVKAHCGHDCH